MPCLQFTDTQYAELAVSAGIKADPETAARELRRVHRLLAVDGYQVGDLMAWEQEYARALTGKRLTSIAHINEGEYVETRHEVFDVDEDHGRTPSETPRARCGRAVRDKRRETHPCVDSRFYHQLHHGFREDWFRTREQLAAERRPEESAAVEAFAKARYEAEQAERLADLDARIGQWEAEIAALDPKERARRFPVKEDGPDPLDEQRARFEAARVKLSRPWEALDYWKDQYMHRFASEEAWFNGTLSAPRS